MIPRHLGSPTTFHPKTLLTRRTPTEPLIQVHLETARVSWRDVVRFDRSFWYLLALCVLFYAVVVPYRSTFAIKYFQHAHDLSLAAAATINSYVYLPTIFVTPVFGWVVDRFGYRALTMVFDSLLLPLSIIGVVLGGNGLMMTSLMLGISYSLIPAILRPASRALMLPCILLLTAISQTL